MVANIQLHSKKYPGFVALVDDDDFEKVADIHWYPRVRPNGLIYARGVIEGKIVFMHRFILDLKDPGIIVDHSDGNGLNNTRGNIRTCTTSQNAANRRPRRNTSSQFKGVYWNSTLGIWQASIGIKAESGRKVITLGSFRSEEEAAKAYNQAAIHHFGEFARINEIDAS